MMVGYDRILEELKRGVAGKPELAETVALYVDLLSAQAHADVASCEYAALAREAASRIQGGLPILSPEALQVHGAAFVHLCDEVCTITAGHRPDLAEALDSIRVWLQGKREAVEAVGRAYLREGCPEEAVDAGLDAALLEFVLNHALHPFLRAAAEALAPLVDEAIWYRGYCPICGGEPDFAVLEKETGARRVLCSRCDMEWHCHRILCPFCGDENHVSYYDTGNGYRLYVCEACKGYLKTLDLRAVADERLMPVERIVTIAMDLAARQGGWGQT